MTDHDGACLHELFAEQAAATPEAVAVACGDRLLTYAELDARAELIAQGLRAHDVGPEVVVAVALPRGVDLVATLLGVLKAGGAYLPLDLDSPPDRLAGMLADAGAALVIAADPSTAAWAGAVCPVLDPDVLAAAGPSRRTRPEPGPDNLAYVIYTSGSTGRPKPVGVCHRGLANHALAMRADYRLTAADRFLQFANAGFDVAAEELYPTLLAGGTVVVFPAIAPAVDQFEQWLAEHRVTVVTIRPSYWRQWTEDLVTGGRVAPPDLRLLIVGGEAADADTVRRWQAQTGVPLVVAYGITETTVTTTTSHGPFPDQGAVPVGTAVSGCTVHVLDPAGDPVQPGTPGEVYIGGAGLARGYLGRPGLTAERFVPSPDRPGERLYRTGDRARELPGGELELLGRIDHQVKIRGFRIELGEVEAALMTCPGVQAAVVTVHDGQDGDRRLAAHLVAEQGRLVRPAAVRHFLARTLPRPLIPASIALLDTLPLTPSGKVDRSALASREVDRTAFGQSSYVAPGDPVSQAVADVWAEVLGVDRVGMHDDFFELGGHSLSATRVMFRLRRLLGVELPIGQVFETRTVATLAEAVAGTPLARSAPPIRPVPRAGALPLSFVQQRLWLLDRLGSAGAEYLVPLALRLRGPLDVDQLVRAYDALVAGQEILRTRYADAGGEPVQLIEEPGVGGLVLTDLSGLPRMEAEARADELAEADTGRPFALDREPPLRGRLVRLSDSEHLLVVVFHHIACDGWSIDVFARELADRYRGEAPVLAVQYADFAVWQRAQLTQDTLAAQLGFWRDTLADAVPLELPTDRPRPTVWDGVGESLVVDVPEPVASAVLDIGRSRGATPFITLLAAFKALLARYSGRRDIVIGTPIAGRTRAETEDVIGAFLNTLVLRTDLSEVRAFGELVEEVRRCALAAYANQDVPFEWLVDELGVPRDLSRNPLFSVLFDLRHATEENRFAFDGVTVEEVPVRRQTAKFDLTMAVEVRPDRSMRCHVEFATALFDRATVARFATHFLRLLESIAADPDVPVLELDILTPAERGALVYGGNDTAYDWPPGCVHEVFARQAMRTPEAVAVTAGEQQLSYQELNTRAGRLARRLAELGVGPERVVAVCVDRGPDLLIALLAVLKAGGAYLPLEPSHPRDRLVSTARDMGAGVVLTQPAYRERLASAADSVVVLDNDAADGEEFAVDGDPDRLAYVMCTSGTTGRPKGVLVDHRSLMNYLWWTVTEYVGAGEGGTALFSSAAYDLAVPMLYAPLLVGQPVRMLPADHDLAELGALLVESGPYAFLKMTPSHLSVLAGQLTATQARGLAEVVVVGGEPLSGRLAEQWRALTGTGPKLINEYGPTEITVGNSAYVVAGAQPCEPLPIGKPMPNTTAYVLDDRLNPVPPGAVGEVYVGGVGVTRGYLNQSAMTAARFVPDPFAAAPGRRLYRTGDLGRVLPGGDFAFLGRTDAQLKLHGYRIEPGEIETVLGTHAGVRGAAVKVQEDASGTQTLVAYYSRTGAAEVDDAELRAFLTDRLPAHLVPALFAVVERIPLTANGKTDYRALPVVRPAEEGGAPRTPVEEVVMSLWTELLGVEHFGVTQNFFHLGGNSLLAVRLVSTVEDKLDVRLSVRDVFTASTVERFAALVERRIYAQLAELSEEELRHALSTGDQ